MKQICLILAVIFIWSNSALAGDETRRKMYSKNYRRCLQQAPDDDDLKILECTKRELKIQDIRLNSVYKALLKGYGEAQKNELRKSQRAWLKFRDAWRDYLLDPAGGATTIVIASFWLAEATAEQAVALEYLASDLAVEPEEIASAQEDYESEPMPARKPLTDCKPEDMTMAGMARCEAKEFEKQDIRLNIVYKALMARESEDRKPALREAQRAWMEYRDALLYVKGRSRDRLIFRGMKTSATADQASRLEQRLEIIIRCEAEELEKQDIRLNSDYKAL